MANPGFLRRNGDLLGAIAIVAIAGAVALWLFLWTPGEGDYKSPWAVPIATVVFLFLLYLPLTVLMRRGVVAEMRSATPADLPAPPTAGASALLAPPLRLEIVTTEEVQSGSARELPTAARGRRLFDQYVGYHRRQVRRLITATLLIGLLGLIAERALPIRTSFLFILVSASFVLWLAGRFGRGFRLTISQAGWLVLHGTWLAIVVFVAGWYLLNAIREAWLGQWNTATIVLTTASVLLPVFAHWRGAAERHRLRETLTATPPVRLLFLWVFGDGTRLVSLLSGVSAVWRSLGPLQFLQGGGMIGMGSDTFRYFRRGGGRLVAATDQEVDARIAAFKWRADPRWAQYPTNTLLCGDASWRHALERLLDTDAALMDLSGFTAANAGCVHELGRLIDRLPVARFLLLVDDSTDMTALRTILESAWSGMDGRSPNNRAGCPPIRLLHCEPDYDEKKQARPLAMMRNSDSTLDLLCAGIDRAPRDN